MNGAYTTYFNVKRGRAGHLFQGRYKAILVDKDAYAKELSRYIHLNPVRAGMVEKPQQHPWSSYRAYSGLTSALPWLHREFILSFFGPDRAQERYREFVEGQIGQNCPNPFENVTASTLLGRESFVNWVRETFLKQEQADRDLPALRRLTNKPTLEAIRTAVEGMFIDDRMMARRVGMFLCRRHSGLKLKEICTAYGVGESAVTQASRRVEAQMKQSESVRKAVEMLEKKVGMSKV